jgi:two-component system response regulator HydG
MAAFTVVEFTRSFHEVWAALARDLEIELRTTDGSAAPPTQQDVVAMVLAGGGAEREMVGWLERHAWPIEVSVFAVGAETDRRAAIAVVAAGASDYFALPSDLELLRNALASAVARHAQAARGEGHGEEEASTEEAFREIVGNSPSLRGLLNRAAKVLRHRDATALIVGETGTGKELLARALHQGGPRKAAPFVAVNCSALPPNLMESELFGHERGAFTNAHAARPGLFEMADGGTLFLDEIGTLPVDLQAKLLRVLEDREVRRVGGTKSRRVDIRVVAATNENLHRAIRNGAFRQDLYFRLSVVTFTLPPLRERGDDVLSIAQHFLTRLAAQHALPEPALTPEVRRALIAYAWPGNVRELKNAIERAVLLSPPGKLLVSELVPDAGEAVPREVAGPIPFPARLDEIMVAAAQATLELCSGNRSEAARRLQISRRRLRRLVNGDASGIDTP